MSEKPIVLSVDLAGQDLNGWLQLGAIGRFFVYSLGRFMDFTREYYLSLVERFRSEGTDVPVDYEHAIARLVRGEPVRREDVEAAAWFDDLEVREDGLYGHVGSWDPEALDKVKNKRFRYLSVYVRPNVPHRRTGERSDWLVSVSLTNIPNQDTIKPLVASAGAETEHQHSEGVSTMLEKLRKFLEARGVTLAADAGEEAMLSALDTWAKQAAESVPASLAAALGSEGDATLSVADAVQRAKDAQAPRVPTEIAAGLGLAETCSVADAAGKILQMRATESGPSQVQAITAAAVQRMRDEALIEAACGDGRIPPAQRPAWEANLYSADAAVCANTRQIIQGLKPTGPAAPPLGRTPAKESEPDVTASAIARELGVDAKKVQEKLAAMRQEASHV